jgi:hypothetical protein
MRKHSPLHLIVLMPLRDDWPSAAELIRRLDKAISSEACTMEIILIDDFSTQNYHCLLAILMSQPNCARSGHRPPFPTAFDKSVAVLLLTTMR